MEEWKLDVPTIGWVYANPTRVVCYFNGLGRPLHLTPDYFESDRLLVLTCMDATGDHQ